MAQKNYAGKKYAHLTMLHFSRGRGAGKHAIWLARCDCGAIKEVVGRFVETGRVKTCGGCEYHKALLGKRGQGSRRTPSPERALYGRYVLQATRKNLEWALTPEDFKEILGKPCWYCGSKTSIGRGKSAPNHSSIDRVEIGIGYTRDNCVSSCQYCSRLKGGLNAGDFLSKVGEIADHLNLCKHAP